MSGNNVPISPRPIAPAPKNSGNDSLKNGNRKLAPRPSEEAKPLLKLQSNTVGKETPTTTSGIRLAPAPQPTGVMAGSYVLRPLSTTPNRATMYPSIFAASNHPQLQQRLQSSTDATPSGGGSNGNNIQAENQLKTSSLSQTVQQQQQPQQRPSAPIPIAPRPISIPTPSTSNWTPSTSATPTQTSAAGVKPAKIFPRPIEKKPTPSSSAAATVSSTASAMNGNNPPNLIPNPILSASGAAGYILQNGALRFPQHPSAMGVQFQNHPQLRFAYNGQSSLNGMQIQHLNSMSIFPQAIPQQIIHPGLFPMSSGAGGTFISQSIPSTSQFQTYLPISAFNASQLAPSFLSHLSQQHQQGSQMQQPKLIPITAAPLIAPKASAPLTSSAISTEPSASASTSAVPIAPNLSSETGTKLAEAGSDDDENEPPPALPLFREEALSIPTSVHEAFAQEASGVRMQFPTRESGETLRHVIDGFIIEESSVPFEIDDVIKEPLEILQKYKPKTEPEDEEAKEGRKKPKNGRAAKQLNGTEIKKQSRRSNNSVAAKVEPVLSPPPSVSARKRRSSSTQRPSSSSNKSIKSSPPERPTSSRKSRELEGLLSMDFGPKNPVFKTTSVAEFTKEVQRQQTALRPVMLHDYKERPSPERIESLDLTDEQCLQCKHTFIELGLRYAKCPQYCSKECRKEYRRTKRRKCGLSETRSLDFSDFGPAAAAAALIAHSPESCRSIPRKRISDESGASTPSPMKSSPLKLKMRSSSDFETFSDPSVFSPPPTTSLLVQAQANSGTPEFSKSIAEAGLSANDVAAWSAEDVEKWVNCVTSCQTYGPAFRREEIDGSSLLMLNSEHLKTSLGIRLGPALKIEKAIDWLRTL